MRIVSICFCVAVLWVSTALSQQKVDVVYLHNGEVRKGTIIEDVPNDHIKIETSDGSVYMVKYSDIQKRTQETKSAAQQNGTASEIKTGLASRSGDAGIAAILFLPGTIHLGDYDLDVDKSTNVGVRIFYDAYLMDKLSMGVYAMILPVSLKDFSTKATMYEFCFAIKPRFLLSDGQIALKPGLSIGYRRQSSDLENVNKSNALAVNGGLEAQMDIQ